MCVVMLMCATGAAVVMANVADNRLSSEDLHLSEKMRIEQALNDL